MRSADRWALSVIRLANIATLAHAILPTPPEFVTPSTSSPAPCPPPGLGIPAEPAQWFADEVHAHDSQLKAYLRSAYPTVGDVDDVIQESYLRVWKAQTMGPIRSAKAFLFRIARNIAVDLLRRRQASPFSPIGDLARLAVIEDGPGVAETIGIQEKIALLTEALETLPPRRREIVICCKLQGLSYRDAARKFGLSEKTIAEHVYRGAQCLGEELARRGVSSFVE